jgi:hypothetical protein
MTIAVHITVSEIQNDIGSNFNYNCFTILAGKYPDNHYIFIFDKPFASSLIKEKNITPVLAGPAIKNRLLQYYFYNFKIPKLLNKYNADFFVSAEVCSLRTNIPQCIIITDLSFLKKNNLLTRTDCHYLKKYLKFFIKRSARIVVLNPLLKTMLAKSFPTDDNKINSLDMGVDDELKAISFEKAEEIRNKFTEGKEYFLFFYTASTAANTITVLKAFSIFKKWQKSNMQLAILSDGNIEKIVQALSTYKHRDDVKMVSSTSLELRKNIIAAAYAGIHLPAIEITETDGFDTLACEIPLLTTDNEFCKSIYQDAALYSHATEKEIAEKMMLVYKDEVQKNELVKKGNAVISTHKWQNTADSLLQTIVSYTE